MQKSYHESGPLCVQYSMSHVACVNCNNIVKSVA